MQFKVEIRESKKAKNISMRILDADTIQLIIPKRLRNKKIIIDKLLREKKAWVEKHLRVFKKREQNKKYLPEKIEFDDKILEGNKLKDWAKQKITNTARDFAKRLKFNFDKIYIRNQKTRWGSCSSRGNLSFNYKIALLPNDLFEYIILHELMHLRHPHHQKTFWQDLNYICADVKEKRKSLHQYSTR